jgi:hypothetical protein
MNSPFVAEQARAVTMRREVAWTFTQNERIRRIYQAVLSRDPSSDELALARDFIGAARTDKAARGQLGSWELFVQVLMLSNEFAFVD